MSEKWYQECHAAVMSAWVVGCLVGIGVGLMSSPAWGVVVVLAVAVAVSLLTTLWLLRLSAKEHQKRGS